MLLALGVPAVVGGWEIGVRAAKSAGFAWDERFEEWREVYDSPHARVIAVEWFRPPRRNDVLARLGVSRFRAEEERDRPATVREWFGAASLGYVDFMSDEQIGRALHIPAGWFAAVPFACFAVMSVPALARRLAGTPPGDRMTA